jgi:hypothetical protein
MIDLDAWLDANHPAEGANWTLTDASALIRIPGDFNNNGTVDAADYVVWRKTDGMQDGYNLWRMNFGRTSGASAMLGSTAPPVRLSPNHQAPPCSYSRQSHSSGAAVPCRVPSREAAPANSRGCQPPEARPSNEAKPQRGDSALAVPRTIAKPPVGRLGASAAMRAVRSKQPSRGNSTLPRAGR